MEILFTIRVDSTLLALSTRFLTLGQQILQKEVQIMATLQQDVDAIAAETTAIASLTTFVQGLETQIAALPGLTATQQTQIDAIFDGVTKNAASITAALTMNVQPTPPPATVPPVVS